jgi:hypothetical protein
MSDTKRFGDSAYVAHMQAAAPRQLVEAELVKLLGILGQSEEAVAVELSAAPVPNVALSELQAWNALLAPNDQRDCLGAAAARFFAAQALVTTVMRLSALDMGACYPAEIALAMQAGADGLFEFGRAQFEALARLARALSDWIIQRRPRSVALIESPSVTRWLFKRFSIF